ncbi:MAG: hypothetical protein KJ600_03670 [Nanoarchaeota archaeon]|nr:hypothetical protein [Nanoarchaeota archaeon]MBU1103626.1 hypothetical protein [Nanoarchaeota archaeon]
MRRIISKERKEEKKKRNMLIASFFMLFVLVFGTVGYGFLSSSRTDSNTDETSQDGVRYTGSRWVATVNDRDFYFLNSPESVENISVETSFFLNSYAGLPLYLISDNSAVNSEIAATLGQFTTRVQEACYGPCDKDLPEKNCSENLIIWKDSPISQVYQEENCIFIEGDMRAVDAFLYNLLEIN